MVDMVDIELNSLNLDNNVILHLDNNVVIVYFSNNEKAGITLENNYINGSKKCYHGVRVLKITERDNCYKSGLRIGDVILLMNNVSCTNHKQSVDIIDKCVLNNTPLICVLFKNNSNRM